MSERIVCNDNGGELREEIVRCRDCKHFFPYFTRHDPETPNFCELHGSDWVWPDSFCSGGERLQDAAGGGRICAEEGGKL